MLIEKETDWKDWNIIARVVWKTALNEKYGDGAGSIAWECTIYIHLELSQNQQMQCQSIIKFESLLRRQIPKNISLQLVASAQFSSEQLVLSTLWQTGVVFRVAVATDTVIWARNVNAVGEIWKAVMWSFHAFIDIFNIEKEK